MVADLATGSASGQGADTLTADENLTGSSHDDSLSGDGADNSLDGNAGNDTLAGGPGNDLLNGGPGTDTVDYSSSGAGVVADLATGSASGQGADTLTADENLTGSSHDDSLSGDGADNSLDGNAGNDTLAGGPGNDLLNGGGGDDAIYGDTVASYLANGGVGGGRDTLNGGAGYDTAYGGKESEAQTCPNDEVAFRCEAGEGPRTLASRPRCRPGRMRTAATPTPIPRETTPTPAPETSPSGLSSTCSTRCEPIRSAACRGEAPSPSRTSRSTSALRAAQATRSSSRRPLARHRWRS